MRSELGPFDHGFRKRWPTALTYTVKELFLTVQGDNISRVAVFSLCRLQLVVRTGRGSGTRSLPILRHRLRRRNAIRLGGSLG